MSGFWEKLWTGGHKDWGGTIVPSTENWSPKNEARLLQHSLSAYQQKYITEAILWNHLLLQVLLKVYAVISFKEKLRFPL